MTVQAPEIPDVFVQYFQSGSMPYAGYDGASDTYILQGTADENYGNIESFAAGWTSAGVCYGLVKFNLTALPSQAQIREAYLLLSKQMLTGQDFTLNLYEVINYHFSETGAFGLTWNLWQSGYAEGDLAGTFQIYSGVDKYSVKLNNEIIKKWIISNTDNRGLIIRSSDNAYVSDRYAYFYSRETASSYNRPMLAVYYTLPSF